MNKTKWYGAISLCLVALVAGNYLAGFGTLLWLDLGIRSLRWDTYLSYFRALDAMVVLDIKQENYELTSGWRASQGQAVFLFNPFAEGRRTHRWNPLSYVSSDPAFRVFDLTSIAAMLYPDGSDDQKFWVSQARNAFMAFALSSSSTSPGRPS